MDSQIVYILIGFPNKKLKNYGYYYKLKKNSQGHILVQHLLMLSKYVICHVY